MGSKSRSKKKRRKILLTNNRETHQLKLLSKENLAENIRKFRFALPKPNQVLGLPVGNHTHLIATINGQRVVRAYTPVSIDSTAVGYADFVVKIYRPAPPRYPKGGLMSQYLDSLPVDSREVSLAGPFGRIVYQGCGRLSLLEAEHDNDADSCIPAHSPPYNITRPSVTKTFRCLGLIAGGTGITPMYKVAKRIFTDKQDKTQVWVLYADTQEGDMLHRKPLDKFAEQRADQFHVWYSLERPPASGWRYSQGYVTESMMRQHLPLPAADTACLLCGPPPMLEACVAALQKIGHSKENIFTY